MRTFIVAMITLSGCGENATPCWCSQSGVGCRAHEFGEVEGAQDLVAVRDWLCGWVGGEDLAESFR